MRTMLPKIRWIYHCSIMLLLNLCCYVQAHSQCAVIYASPTGLALNDGSEANPVDLQTALAQACSQSRLHIRLMSGTYNLTSKMIIGCNNVIIDGDWEVVAGVGRKNSNLSTTINIDALLQTSAYDGLAGTTVGYYIGVEAIGRTGFRIEDITFNVKNGGASGVPSGTTGNRGNSVYGFYFRSCSGWTLERCIMSTGSGTNGSNGVAGAASLNGNGGGAGVSGHCDNNSSAPAPGGGGGAVGAGARQGGAGGSGGQGSSDNANNNQAGTNGSNGGAGAAGGTAFGAAGSNGTSCGSSCDRDGRAGQGGAAGTSGTAGAVLPVSAIFDFFWLPSGQSNSGTDGTGGGGGKGGGGGGRQSDSGCGFLCVCDDGPGGGGGGGGSGGQGGQAGTGGFGGGASFPLYVFGGTGIRNNTTLNAGAAALGGIGGAGATGGLGGASGIGGGGNNTSTAGGCGTIFGRACGNTEVGAGGQGGAGGAGGDGGNGGNGAAGLSVAAQLVSGATTTVNTTGAIAQIITNQPLQGCANSEILITKNGGTWGLTGSGSFINDLNTASSSYNTASPTALISYSTTGSQSINISGVSYGGFIQINTARPLPTFAASMPTIVCEGNAFPMSSPTLGAQYEWVIFPSAGSTAAPTAVFTTSVASWPTPVTGTTTNYRVRLRVRENCCGWSTPVYFDFQVVATATPPTGTGATICAGQTATITAVGSGAVNMTWFADPLGQIPLQTTVGPNVSFVTPVLTQNTIFYVGESVGGCVGVLEAVQVVVNQLPNAPSAAPVQVCEGQNVILSATGSGTGNLVFYNSAMVQIASIPMGGVPTQTFNAGPLAAGSYSFYVRESGATCQSLPTLIGVTVNPIPTAPTASGTTICAGNSTTLTATGTGSIQWYSDAAMTSLVGMGANYNTGNLTTTTSYYVAQVSGGCRSNATTVTVTVNPLPANPTGTGATICAGETASISATNSGGTLNWYTDISGTNMVGTGSPFVTPILNQSTTYFVRETNGTTGCMSGMVAVTVTVNPLPNTPSTAPVTICQGDNALLTATGSGTGNLVFYNNTMTQVASIPMGGTPTQTHNAGALATGSYLFYVTEDNGTCESNAAAIGVTVNALPAAPTASGTTICAGNTATLTATATGTANWYSDAALTNLISTGSVYTTGALTANTDYYVTQVNANGCEGPSTTVTVTVNALPANPTGTGATICAGQTATLTAAGAGGTLNWYGDASGSVVLATGTSFTTPVLNQNATYYVQETSGAGCVSGMVAVVATVNALPTAPSSNGMVVCEGQNVILAATGSGTGNLVFFDNTMTQIASVPMIGSATQIYNAGTLAAGVYTFYVTESNGTCQSAAVGIAVLVTAAPAAPTAAGTTICAGNTATLTAAGNVRWYSDATLTNLLSVSNTLTTGVLTTNTDYYVVASSANGCTSASTTVTVTVNALPAAPTTTPTAVCEGSSATLTAAGAGGTLNWYSDATGTNLVGTGTTLTLPVINQNTTFYVNETNGTTGCVSPMATATITVNALPNAPSASDISICNGADVILSATGSGTGDLAFYNSSNVEISRFTMSAGNTTGTFNAGALAVGNYVFFVTEDAGACESTLQSINVEVRQLPAAPTAFNDSPVCEGETVFLQANTVVGATYMWIGPNGFSTTAQNFSVNNATGTQAGVYTVSITLNGCTSTAGTTTVTINPRPVIAGSITSNSPLCEFDALNVSAPLVANASYAWTGPNGFTATTQGFNISSVNENDNQGFYAVVATDNTTGCSSLPLSTLVMITSLPNVGVATNNSPVCFGNAVQLEIPEIFGATYAWTGPNGFTSTLRNPSLTISSLDTGTYTVVVTVGGCSSSYNTYVSGSPSPTITVMPDTTIASNETLVLWASGGIIYEWLPSTNLNSGNVPNPLFTPSGVGTYNFLVRTYNNQGCMAQDELNITVVPVVVDEVRIVDLFTPNGDGVNDYWPVPFLQDPSVGAYTLRIMTRGGMEVWNTQNYQNDWYGKTSSGQNLPDGTYWYIINLENGNKILKGAVTIKR